MTLGRPDRAGSFGGEHAARAPPRASAVVRRATRSCRLHHLDACRARSATRSVPGARTEPSAAHRHRPPSASSMRSRAMPPSRRIGGRARCSRRSSTPRPTAARSAVEHDVDVVAEVGAHVGGGRGAHAPEPVGRRRRDSAAERAQQRERDRLVGHPQRRPCRSPPVTSSGTRSVRAQHERERPGPERRRQPRARRRDRRRPLGELRRRRRGARSPGGRPDGPSPCRAGGARRATTRRRRARRRFRSGRRRARRARSTSAARRSRLGSRSTVIRPATSS